MACAPEGQVSRRREGSNLGRLPRGAIASSPLAPSTITLRASGSDAAISAIRAAGLASATARTHSAPARVLPNPRPARISQTVQGQSGGN